MQLFYEIFPVFLFFIAFKFYGIYVATAVGMITTAMQVVLTRFFTKAWDKKQLITLAIFVLFGGMTLYFQDPIFVKWKPTIIFWLFALVILGSQLFTTKPIMQRMMEGAFKDQGDIPISVWKKINLFWAVFFISLGTVNLYIAYTFSNDAWVNFKFYGITAALFMVSLFQALCLVRYTNKSTE